MYRVDYLVASDPNNCFRKVSLVFLAVLLSFGPQFYEYIGG